MLTTACTALALMLPSVALAANKYPPVPSFETRYDYISWYDDRLESDDDENTYIALAEFMPGLVDSDASEGDWPKFVGMLTAKTDVGLAVRSDSPDARWPGPSPWNPDRNAAWEVSYKRTKKVLKKYAAAAAKNKVLDAPTGLSSSADDKANRLMFIARPHLRHLGDCVDGSLEAAWRLRKEKVSPDKLIAAIQTNLRIADQMRDSLTIAEQLFACVIRERTYANIRWGFAHGVLTPKHAERLVGILKKIDRQPIDVSPLLQGECATWLDAIQYIYGPQTGGGTQMNGNRYSEITGQSMGGFNRLGIGARIETDPKGAAKAIRDGFEAMERHMEPGFTAANHENLVTLGNRMAAANKLTKALLLGNTGAWPHAYVVAARCEADRRATRLVVELFAYKNEKGRWPKSLGMLKDKSLKKIKRDVFRNKPFVYILMDEQPFLYSVGQDGQDDGGTHGRWESGAGSDPVFWPVPNSAELVAASKLNCVPTKRLTAIAKIGSDLEGKNVTIAAEVADEYLKRETRLHTLVLQQDGADINLVYDASVVQDLTANQAFKAGVKIRALATVEKGEDGKWRLRVQRAPDIAMEE